MVGLYLQCLAVLLAHLSNSRVSPNPPLFFRNTGNISTIGYPGESSSSRAMPTNHYFQQSHGLCAQPSPTIRALGLGLLEVETGQKEPRPQPRQKHSCISRLMAIVSYLILPFANICISPSNAARTSLAALSSKIPSCLVSAIAISPPLTVATQKQ